jgi:general secretion pathway protein D
VLERIDRPRPQVRITALIYDLSLQDVEQLGLNWGSAGKGNTVNADGDANQALEFDTQTLAPFQAGEAGGTLTVRSLTRNFDINTVAMLLQTASDARLLANPNVVVEDNEEAVWKSVSEIPYQQITQSELGGQIGTTAFKEAGITLAVKPNIAGDGTIEMFVTPEFSRLAGFTPQENQPIIDTRKATTTVRIANRQTLVLSGLRQRSDTGEFNGIPYLKDVKFVGPLFRSRDTNVRESELIVFIMPEIVDYEEDMTMREAVALETVNCRLDAIPPAEGCEAAGCGPDDCAGAELVPLPSVDGEALPAAETMLPPSPPAPTAASGSAMRPAYEARFRATNGTALRPPASQAPAPEKKPSAWKRMFGS